MRSPNPHRYSDDGLTVFVELAGGEEVALDAEDYPIVAPFRWWLNRQPHSRYALANTPGLPRKVLRMHRVIMGATAEKVVDHIDGNGLDNRKHNLRLCSKKENNRNSRKHSGTSQWKGVSWDKACRYWVGRITVDYKQIHLGSFQNEADAARAYNAAAALHYGEFAVLNVIDAEPQESKK